MATIKIALDAGHGLKTSGKQTPDGIKEWTLNDKVRDKVVALLKDYDVKFVFPDNNEGNTDEGLTARRTMYVKEQVAAAVSIHHNAGGGTGVETYYHTYGSSADKKIAQIVQSNLVKETGMRNRGVKQASFAVLTCKSSIPAILVEGGFYDNQTDFNYITSVNGQKAYARAVANSIIQYLGLTKKTPTTTTTSVKVGDKVKVKSTATTYANSTKNIPQWVKNGTYTVSKISGSKVLLKEITSWVNVNDVSKVGSTSTSNETTSFKIKVVNCDYLNARKGAGTNYAVASTVKVGTILTIVGEVNGWYKTKSGLYVSKIYCKKI